MFTFPSDLSGSPAVMVSTIIKIKFSVACSEAVSSCITSKAQSEKSEEQLHVVFCKFFLCSRDCKTKLNMDKDAMEHFYMEYDIV